MERWCGASRTPSRDSPRRALPRATAKEFSPGVRQRAARGPGQPNATARRDCRARARRYGASVAAARDRRAPMTSKSDFTTEEWKQVLEAPPSAGMIVITAQRGGSFRETFAMAKSYTEARQQHGKSELLDDIVAAKPERDHTHYHSAEEVKTNGLQHLRDAVALLGGKATPEEV